jgi:tetratricopeptide (TPR) repeat protein
LIEQTLIFFGVPMLHSKSGLALAFCLLLNSLGTAQNTSGTIVGQLRVARGSFPVNPVLVSLEGRGAVINSVYSDNEGRFTFAGLPGNVYHVVISEKEYLPVRETIAMNPETGPMALVTIFLAPVELRNSESKLSITGGNTRLTDAAEYRNVPKPARKEYEKGLKADKAGKLVEATQHYVKAIDLYPDFYAARNNLGTALMNRSEYSQAKEQFEKVVALNATDAASYFNLANLYILTKQAENAQLWIERGLSRQPDSALGHFLQGSLYEMTGKFKEAETSLRRSIELDPLMAKAHLALVNLYLRTKRDEHAVSELRAFLTAFPNDAFAPKAKQVLKRLEGGSAASDPLTR